MNRWHSPRERTLMLSRWRLEIAQHEKWPSFGQGRKGFRQYGFVDQAPLPPLTDGDSCHCYRGMGYFRKRHPLDCGNPRCGLCHYGKFHTRKARASKRREAIEFELHANA